MKLLHVQFNNLLFQSFHFIIYKSYSTTNCLTYFFPGSLFITIMTSLLEKLTNYPLETLDSSYEAKNLLQEIAYHAENVKKDGVCIVRIVGLALRLIKTSLSKVTFSTNLIPLDVRYLLFYSVCRVIYRCRCCIFILRIRCIVVILIFLFQISEPKRLFFYLEVISRMCEECPMLFIPYLHANVPYNIESIRMRAMHTVSNLMKFGAYYAFQRDSNFSQL